MLELALRVGIKARGGTGKFLCKSCSFSPILDSELVPDRFRLTVEDISSVKHVVSELLRKETDVKDLDNNNVHAVVQQVVNIIEAAAGELECLSVVASKLHKFFLFANIDVEGSVFLTS
ncbi:unnamed protein product [Lactuca saligna]|uniref:Uncharacterized protein n=1 Tax=Lactuca saligna TaxID=75948 RepID=A0AA35Z1Z1_LACSI|nr:unnamed protein product [Lactuca saligna]